MKKLVVLSLLIIPLISFTQISYNSSSVLDEVQNKAEDFEVSNDLVSIEY